MADEMDDPKNRDDERRLPWPEETDPSRLGERFEHGPTPEQSRLIRTDQIVTGALDTVEEAGTKLRRGVLGPVQSVVAVVRGIQTGLEFFRERRNDRRPPTAEPVPESQDESLFI